MSGTRVTIVGGGVASAAAIAALRGDGFDGGITLVSAEETVPYERPPLSKEYLLGDTADVTVVHDEAWYASHDVDLLLGTRATGLDLAARRVFLDGGTAPLGYDTLLLATGVRPRRIPGFECDGVCYLRTSADAADLRDRIRAAEHVAVLGGGFIGCEVAAAAILQGKRVTLLEALPELLQRTLGPRIGGVIASIHRDAGVEVRTGQTVTGVAPRTGGGVWLSTPDGSFPCDVLVIGVGTVPNAELAAAAGLPTSGGIAVDEYFAAAPGVYAAGDVAAQYLPRYGQRVRVEHHDTAARHGRAAARSMLGKREPFSDVHWFWSDQYQHSIQSAGLPDGSPGAVIRGSLDERSFSAFSLDGGRVRAVVSLNRQQDVIETRRLIAREHSVTAAQLRDESTPVKRLAARPPDPSQPPERDRTSP
ncbi:MAG: 3-phenylpropionate/trans-cinnamate dioxygenase ferredoxin reductase component [Trebonia sp.]|nr:3-phenylpropionate/trans-cinnamate dioxygenase ferredoxin reductase component [Trebonia sp.]